MAMSALAQEFNGKIVNRKCQCGVVVMFTYPGRTFIPQSAAFICKCAAGCYHSWSCKNVVITARTVHMSRHVCHALRPHGLVNLVRF